MPMAIEAAWITPQEQWELDVGARRGWALIWHGWNVCDLQFLGGSDAANICQRKARVFSTLKCCAVNWLTRSFPTSFQWRRLALGFQTYYWCTLHELFFAHHTIIHLPAYLHYSHVSFWSFLNPFSTRPRERNIRCTVDKQEEHKNPLTREKQQPLPTVFLEIYP